MDKFHLIEINNKPVSNIIALKKGIAQNLKCNRFSEFVPIQWLKVNLSLFSVEFFHYLFELPNFIQDGKSYSGLVFGNKTTSVLSLKGNANEVGTYECRWNNSRGEARHRQFDVSVKFFDEKIYNNIIIISATVFGLLLIGIGIGIKFYLDKVGNKLILNADQLTNIQSFKKEK